MGVSMNRAYLQQWHIPSTSGRTTFITHKQCGFRSWNPKSVKDRYCEKCRRILTDPLEYELGDYYIISQKQNGEYECTCPHWIYRRGDNGSGVCGHIRYVMANRETVGDMIAIPREAYEIFIEEEAKLRSVADSVK